MSSYEGIPAPNINVLSPALSKCYKLYVCKRRELYTCGRIAEKQTLGDVQNSVRTNLTNGFVTISITAVLSFTISPNILKDLVI